MNPLRLMECCCRLLRLVLLFRIAYGSSFNQPHPHQGIASPFQPGDPGIMLDTAALRLLASGKPYKVGNLIQ